MEDMLHEIDSTYTFIFQRFYLIILTWSNNEVFLNDLSRYKPFNDHTAPACWYNSILY